MGVELQRPLLSDACRGLNFTNEIGYGSSVRLLKNIVGLWIVQECKREWANAGADLTYAELMRLAERAEPFRSLISPADPRFLAANGMVENISGFCRETDQPLPADYGQFVRCALESLALFYRHTLDELEQLTGRRYSRLHIVGGGSKNNLLNQFTANAIDRPVLVGPAEATAAGNVLIQAITVGEIRSLAQARVLVSESMQIRTFLPRDSAAWDEACQRLRKWLRPA